MNRQSRTACYWTAGALALAVIFPPSAICMVFLIQENSIGTLDKPGHFLEES